MSSAFCPAVSVSVNRTKGGNENIVLWKWNYSHWLSVMALYPIIDSPNSHFRFTLSDAVSVSSDVIVNIYCS